MKLNYQPEIVDNKTAKYSFERFDLKEYDDLINIRQLPDYKVTGRQVTFAPEYIDEYLHEQSSQVPLEINSGLFDYQQVITRVAYLKKKYAIFADAGLGKCHGKDTPILMYDGSIKMVQNILVGDLLMGPDSKPKKVLSTNKDYGDLFRVNPTKGDSFVCNDVHVLSLRCTGTKQNDNSGQYVKNKLINISLDEYLEKGPLFKSYYKLWRTGVHFPEKAIPFDPYMVGLYLGDGHKHVPAITTSNRNIEVAEYINRWADDNDLDIRSDGSGDSTTRFFTNKYKHNGNHYQLQNLCYRDEEKRIPDSYLKNHKTIRLEVLAGLIDSDGYQIANCYEIVSKYKGLAEDIVYLCRSLGLAGYLKEVTKTITSGKYKGYEGIYYKVAISGDTYQIPVKVERKKAKPRKQIKNVLNTGFSVEYIGKGNYYGFTLDGDGLYLLGDFTVTHNTIMLGELARQIYASHSGKILFVVPLNIIRQFEDMLKDFYPDYSEFVHLHNNKELSLKEWAMFDGVPRIGFINHEAFIKDCSYLSKYLDCIIVDESSILKGGAGGNGKIAKHLIKVCRDVEFCYLASATPSPNDKTEYAMHAMALGKISHENEFYAMFFTVQGSDYILKRNAVKYFYRYLSSWSIFIRDPKAYGFNDNLAGLKNWKEVYQSIPLTPEQDKAIKKWATQGKQVMLDNVPVKPRGMKQRGKFSQISKGFYYRDQANEKGVNLIKSNKPQAILDIVESHKDEQVLIWTVFDTEGDILQETMEEAGYTVAHITGKTNQDKRLELIEDFRHNKIQVMISKPRILGFGLNFQFCRIAIFSGLDDSYEKYYQAVKRIHRYGQTKQVLIYHIYTDYEYTILGNVMEKQKSTLEDFAYQERQYQMSLYDELKEFLEMPDSLKPMEANELKYEPAITDHYQVYHGDSLRTMIEVGEGSTNYKWLKSNSVDLSVFSPPFMGDLFTYSSDAADMGNTRGVGAEGGLDEFMLQFHFFLKGMLTVTKPGRIMAMHLEDVPLRKGLDGFIGLFDFVGEAIREARKAGWILLAKIPILKNQQAQSIIKHISSLAMSNMEHDRLRISPCSNGYLILFRKPGDADIRIADLAKCNDCGWQGYANQLDNFEAASRDYGKMALVEFKPKCPNCESDNTLIYTEFDGNKWIVLAEGAWPGHGMDDYETISKISQSQRWQNWLWTSLGMWPDINETDTYNISLTKEQQDSDKHLCPLPYMVARRAIEMYTLPGETVFTPFAGIGTEVIEAIKAGRKAVGIELKAEYFAQAVKNADKAVVDSTQMTLFDLETLRV